MRRRTFDFLASGIGAALTIVLFVAGGLLTWGANFSNNYVHDQLAAQKIFFPPKSAFAHPVAGSEITPSMVGTVSVYAGQQLLTSDQAQVYANDFIAVHLQEIGGGMTYSQLSGLMFAPNAPKPGTPAYVALQGKIDTVFRGTTLRAMLLEAYGFGKFGQIAGVASTCAFILGGVLLVLTLLGLLHFRRTSDDTPLLRTKDMDLPLRPREPMPV